MSKQKWAAIVYGRSYHLDFRFITIPQDFTSQEIEWVSPYILATTKKARNIANYPRWSLFKNDSYCVIGVTCMVRDLIGKVGKDLTEAIAKDNLGRPLYVFVGYVTHLNRSKILSSFPDYTGDNLNCFQSLYQEIERVWLLRDYDDRKPSLSEYQPLSKEIQATKISTNVYQASPLNNPTKHPEQIFVWRQSPAKNRQLWSQAGRCLYSTSICLNIKEKSLQDSPFLNQTVTDIKKFTVQNRTNIDADNHKTFKQQIDNQQDSSLKEKISTRAKEDIELTIKHAVKLTSSSQKLINNLASWSDSDDATTKRSDPSQDNTEQFGFKNKTKSIPVKKQDWF